MLTIRPAHRTLGCHRRQDRQHAFHAVAEAHVEVPLVVNLEQLDPARARVFWQRLERRQPGRVHRQVHFKAPANPVQKLLFARLLRRLHRIVKADQPDPLLHQLPDCLEAVVLEERVSAATVAINNNSRRAGKSSSRILRPAVAIYLRGYPGKAIQAGFQQQTTSAMFMLARSMAWRTSEEHDLCVPGGGSQRGRQGQGGEENSIHCL